VGFYQQECDDQQVIKKLENLVLSMKSQMECDEKLTQEQKKYHKTEMEMWNTY
jgi:hypothetical protein